MRVVAWREREEQATFCVQLNIRPLERPDIRLTSLGTGFFRKWKVICVRKMQWRKSFTLVWKILRNMEYDLSLFRVPRAVRLLDETIILTALCAESWKCHAFVKTICRYLYQAKFLYKSCARAKITITSFTSSNQINRRKINSSKYDYCPYICEFVSHICGY